MIKMPIEFSIQGKCKSQTKLPFIQLKYQKKIKNAL